MMLRPCRTFPHHLWSLVISHSLFNLHQFWFWPHDSTETLCLKVSNFLLWNPCTNLWQSFAPVSTEPRVSLLPILKSLLSGLSWYHTILVFILFFCLFFPCFLCQSLLLCLNPKCRSLLGLVSPSVMSYTLLALYAISVLATSRFSPNFSLSSKLRYSTAYNFNFLLGQFTAISNLICLNTHVEFPICCRQNDAPSPLTMSISQFLESGNMFMLHFKGKLRLLMELRLIIS